MLGNAYTSGYAEGMRILVDVDTTSNGGAITLDCGSGAKPVYQNDGASNPTAAQWAAGAQVEIAYGSALNSGAGGWRMLIGGASSGQDTTMRRYYVASGFEGGGTLYVAQGFQTSTAAYGAGPLTLFTPASGMFGALLTNGGSDWLQWLGTIPAGFSGSIGLSVFWDNYGNAVGTGTISHNYQVACFTPGTSMLNSAYTFSTAVTVSQTYSGSQYYLGKIDTPRLNVPTCNAGDTVIIRMTRNSGSTADYLRWLL